MEEGGAVGGPKWEGGKVNIETVKCVLLATCLTDAWGVGS